MMNSWAQASDAASTIASLVASGSVSAIFSATVPENSSGSWGTMPI